MIGPLLFLCCRGLVPGALSGFDVCSFRVFLKHLLCPCGTIFSLVMYGSDNSQLVFQRWWELKKRYWSVWVGFQYTSMLSPPSSRDVWHSPVKAAGSLSCEWIWCCWVKVCHEGFYLSGFNLDTYLNLCLSVEGSSTRLNTLDSLIHSFIPSFSTTDWAAIIRFLCWKCLFLFLAVHWQSYEALVDCVDRWLLDFNFSSQHW